MARNGRTIPQDTRILSNADTGNDPRTDPQTQALYTPAFAVIPGRALRDTRLTPFTFRLLCLMCGHANRADRICWPRQETLAAELEAHVGSISRALATLIASGYVSVQRRGFPASNVYRIEFSPNEKRRRPPAAPDTQTQTSPAGFQTSLGSDVRDNSPVMPELTDPLSLYFYRTGTIEQEQGTDTVAHDSFLSPISAPRSGAARSAGSKKPDRKSDPPPPDHMTGTAVERDPLWLAMVACLGFSPAPRTIAYGRWVKAINDLRMNGATPEAIAPAILAYQASFGPRSEVTPLAIAANWPRLQNGADHDQYAHAIQRRATTARRAAKAGGSADDPAGDHARARQRASLQQKIDAALDAISDPDAGDG